MLGGIDVVEMTQSLERRITIQESASQVQLSYLNIVFHSCQTCTCVRSREEN